MSKDLEEDKGKEDTCNSPQEVALHTSLAAEIFDHFPGSLSMPMGGGDNNVGPMSMPMSQMGGKIPIVQGLPAGGRGYFQGGGGPGPEMMQGNPYQQHQQHYA